MNWLLEIAVAGALVAAGDRELEQGRPLEAIRKFSSATDVAPESAHAWFRLARAYQAAGQPKEKLNAFHKARSLAPGNQGIAKALAMALLLSGDPQSAMAHYDVSRIAGMLRMVCWGRSGECQSAMVMPSAGWPKP